MMAHITLTCSLRGRTAKDRVGVDHAVHVDHHLAGDAPSASARHCTNMRLRSKMENGPGSSTWSRIKAKM